MDYFMAGLEMKADRVASAKTEQILCNDYSDVFTGNGYFKGTFSLQVKDNAKPYQVPPRHVAYTLQETIQKGTRKTTSNRYCHHYR